MFGTGFQLNEQSLPLVQEIGKHMPGGFFIYKAAQPEEMLYVNEAVIRIFGCDDLEDFKKLTGYTFRGMPAGRITTCFWSTGRCRRWTEWR